MSRAALVLGVPLSGAFVCLNTRALEAVLSGYATSTLVFHDTGIDAPWQHWAGRRDTQWTRIDRAIAEALGFRRCTICTRARNRRMG